MSDPVEKTSAPKRGRNWMRIALITSLAVNLLIVGALGGALWKHDKPMGRQLDRVSMGLGANIMALPDPKRQELSGLIGKGSENRRAFRRIMRESQKELGIALEAEPFSETAVREAFEKHRDSALARSRMIQAAYVEALIAMTPEERTEHFERVQEIRKDRRGKKRDKKKRD